MIVSIDELKRLLQAAGKAHESYQIAFHAIEAECYVTGLDLTLVEYLGDNPPSEFLVQHVMRQVFDVHGETSSGSNYSVTYFSKNTGRREVWAQAASIVLARRFCADIGEDFYPIILDNTGDYAVPVEPML